MPDLNFPPPPPLVTSTSVMSSSRYFPEVSRVLVSLSTVVRVLPLYDTVVLTDLHLRYKQAESRG